MFCSSCGKENADDAAFCQKCGRAFETEEETRVASRTPAAVSGHRIFSITPTLKLVYVGYVLAVLCAFLLVGVVSVFLTSMVGVWASVILGMALLLVPLFFHIRKKLVRYTLTDAMIEIDRGLVARTTQNIPLRRVQDITVSASMAQRVLGIGDLIVDNASEDGGKVVLAGIDSPKKYADMMLQQLRHLEK